MPHPKAIIMILILFFAAAIIFTVLYVNNQLAIAPSDGLKPEQTGGNGLVRPEQIIEGKVNQIIEAAKQNPASNPDTVRQEIVSAINAEIIKQEANKTPEQKAADLKAQEERQKIIDQINSQIK